MSYVKYLLVIITVFAFFSCSDDESNPNLGNPIIGDPEDSVYIPVEDTTDTSNIDTTTSIYPIHNINYVDSILVFTAEDSLNLQSISYKEIIQHSVSNHEIVLRDDASGLLDTWRYWWYTPLVLNGSNSIDTLVISNRGWSTFYVPIYSYDQKSWNYFDESKVKQISGNRLQIAHSFTDSIVWVARFFPYSSEHLNNYLEEIEDDEYVETEIIGVSESSNDIYRIKITNHSIADENKEVVFVHARTHPAETGQSYVVEGFINSLLKDYRAALDSIVFVVIPMINIDGVDNGNTRTNENIVNLEQNWLMDQDDSLLLPEQCEEETKILRDEFVKYDIENIKVALNLHCSNTSKDGEPFFFYHFGDDTLSFNDTEISLYTKMKLFGDIMQDNYAYGISPINSGKGFVNGNYPESWWWANFRDSVMAVTFETTYSKAGMDHWITIEDMRNTGESLAITTVEYLSK